MRYDAYFARVATEASAAWPAQDLVCRGDLNASHSQNTSYRVVPGIRLLLARCFKSAVDDS